MVCRSTPGNSAITTLARNASHLHDVQVLSLFHEVRSEAPPTTTLPDERERNRFITGAYQRVYTVGLNDRRREDLGSRFDAARTQDVDARTYYAWRNIEERAVLARAAMDTHFAQIARRHSCTPEQAEAAFNTLMHRDYRINGEVPAAPEHVLFSTAHLPRDRGTRVALAMLHAGGPSVASNSALATEVYRATHDTSAHIAYNPHLNPANHCPDCGQFAGPHHTCAPTVADAPGAAATSATSPTADAQRSASTNSSATRCAHCGEFATPGHLCNLEPTDDSTPTPTPTATPTATEPTASQTQPTPAAPRARRAPTPLRNYASGPDSTVRIVNVSSLRTLLRDATPEAPVRVDDVTVHLTQTNDNGTTSTHAVTGSLRLTNTGQRRTRTRDRYTAATLPTGAPDSDIPIPAQRSLQCTCPQYQATYDCEHVRQAVENVQALLNQRDPVAVAPAAATEAVSAELRTEYDASLAAAQDARAAFAQNSDNVSYANDMAAFQSAWDEAKAHFESGEHRLPYLTENATNGLGARDGGRSFGIEIEVDFPDDMTYEAKHRVAREIHEAGLSDAPTVRPWHWRGRETGPRGQQYGGGYTDDPNMWSVEHDSSVDGLNGQRGCEIVSPILYDTPETWANLAKVTEIVERNGGRVTPRTGLHINVGAADFDHTVENHNRLIGLTNAYEDVIVRAAHNPQSGRAHRGREYCRPMTMPTEGFASIRQAQQGLDPRNFGSSHRAMINLDHVPAEGQPIQSSTRVEVRIFDGATDPGRIQANVKMSLALVDAAVRGVEVPAEPEPAGTHRARNAATNGRARRLRGEEWENDTASFRTFLDALYSREEDKRQATYAFAATRWQSQ